MHFAFDIFFQRGDFYNVSNPGWSIIGGIIGALISAFVAFFIFWRSSIRDKKNIEEQKINQLIEDSNFIKHVLAIYVVRISIQIKTFTESIMLFENVKSNITETVLDINADFDFTEMETIGKERILAVLINNVDKNDGLNNYIKLSGVNNYLNRITNRTYELRKSFNSGLRQKNESWNGYMNKFTNLSNTILATELEKPNKSLVEMMNLYNSLHSDYSAKYTSIHFSLYCDIVINPIIEYLEKDREIPRTQWIELVSALRKMKQTKQFYLEDIENASNYCKSVIKNLQNCISKINTIRATLN